MKHSPNYQTRTFSKSAEEARRAALNSLGITPREGRDYSLMRALRKISEGKPLDGFEGETNQQMIHLHGPTDRQNSLRIPTGLALGRGLSTASNGGGNLVGTTNMGGSFIEMLRKASISDRLGVTWMRGLQGNVTIPKQLSSASAHWLASEAEPIAKSNQTFGQVSLSPKNVGAYTEVSRQLMIQSDPSVEQVVMEDLAKVLAEAIDTALITGTGADGQPRGLIGTAGVGSVSGTALGAAGLLEFQSDIASSNGLSERMAYVTTPAVAAQLLQRFTNSTYGERPLWDGSVLRGMVMGYPAHTSAIIPAATMILGDWSQIVLAEWGVLELAVNPYADFEKGVTGIRAWATVDVGIRHPESFSVATSIT